MNKVVLLVCFLLSLCAAVTSLMAWQKVQSFPPAPPQSSAEIDQLSAQVTALSTEVSHLKDAAATATPVAAVTASATVDTAKLKELTHEEFQSQMRAMRAGFNRDDPANIQRQLQEDVALDPAKAAQVAPLVAAERGAVRAIYANANGASRDELQPKVKIERDKLDVAAATILSADEMTKFDTWLDRANRGRPRTANPPPPMPGAPAPVTTPPPGPSSF